MDRSSGLEEGGPPLPHRRVRVGSTFHRTDRNGERREVRQRRGTRRHDRVRRSHHEVRGTAGERGRREGEDELGGGQPAHGRLAHHLGVHDAEFDAQAREERVYVLVQLVGAGRAGHAADRDRRAEGLGDGPRRRQ